MHIEERIDMMWGEIEKLRERIKELEIFSKRFPESKFHWENYTDEALQDLIMAGRLMTGTPFKGTHVEAFGLEIIGACNFVIGKRAEEREKANGKDPDGSTEASGTRRT